MTMRYINPLFTYLLTYLLPLGGFTGDGSVLHTLVLRPTIMYGELDPWFVVSGLRTAKRGGGILLPVGNGKARMQVSYAGNVAWAHPCTPVNILMPTFIKA